MQTGGRGAGRVIDLSMEGVDELPVPPYRVALSHVLGLVREREAVSLRWYRGFRLAAADVPDDFRGPAMPRLARRIAGENGIIDAAVIGIAEASFHHHPEAWRDWGSREEVLQHFKQLWHVLVHYGAPTHRTGGFESAE